MPQAMSSLVHSVCVHRLCTAGLATRAWHLVRSNLGCLAIRLDCADIESLDAYQNRSSWPRYTHTHQSLRITDLIRVVAY